jgi:hypothetical protein
MAAPTKVSETSPMLEEDNIEASSTKPLLARMLAMGESLSLFCCLSTPMGRGYHNLKEG